MPYKKIKSHKKKMENKGVTATVSDINESQNNSNVTEGAQKFIRKNDLQDVKDDLINVIELMGPSTPQLPANSVSEGDNEESYYTSTSFYSSVVQVKHVTISDETLSSRNAQTSDTPRDISQISALPVDSECNPNYPEMNNNNNNNNNNNVTYVDPHAAHYFTCPCRQYAKNFEDFQAANPRMSMFKTKDDYAIIHHKEANNGKFDIKMMTMNLFKIFRSKRHQKEPQKEPTDLYKMNILQPDATNAAGPARLVFDRVEDVPKPEMNTVATNTSYQDKVREIPGLPGIPTPFHAYVAPPRFPLKKKHTQTRGRNNNPGNNPGHNNNPGCKTDKFDVYYFDHGDASYFKTTDATPALLTDVIAEKTEIYTARFWAETFGTVHIGFAFITSFTLQLLKFILHSIVRPLTVGVTQLCSDYFFKPFLAVLFNGVVQPPLVFLYNVATSLRDLADPIAQGLGYFCQEITNVCRAVRVVEVNQCSALAQRRVACKPKKRKRKCIGKEWAC